MQAEIILLWLQQVKCWGRWRWNEKEVEGSSAIISGIKCEAWKEAIPHRGQTIHPAVKTEGQIRPKDGSDEMLIVHGIGPLF